jgi:acyl-CoA thioester hydrolase
MAQPALETDRLERPHRHVHDFHVRFGDLDVLGHVNNCTYLRYLEDARITMLRLDPQREGREPIKGLVVARHEIDYKRPLLFGPDLVRVETWVSELRAASFRLSYEIRDDANLYAQASTVMVAYDMKEGRSRRLSELERSFLAEYQSTGDSSVTNMS